MVCPTRCWSARAVTWCWCHCPIGPSGSRCCCSRSSRRTTALVSRRPSRLAAFAVLLNVLAIVWVLRVRGFQSNVAKILLTADVVIAFAVNLVASLAVQDPGWDEVGEMTWVYLVGGGRAC